MSNRVLLKGNVGSDNFNNLKLKQFPNGTLCINFTLGSHYNTTVNGQKTRNTEWHDLTGWGPIAQRLAQEIFVGAYMWVEGFNKSVKWVDQQGNQRRRTEIQVMSYIIAAKNNTHVRNAYTTEPKAGSNKPVIVNPQTVQPESIVPPPPPTNSVGIPAGYVPLLNHKTGQTIYVPAPPNESVMGGTAFVNNDNVF